MTYDLAFWDGPRPRNDAEATRVFRELVPFLPDDADESEWPEPAPPTPLIAEFARRLTERWPVDERSPWALAPEDLDGPVLYVNLTFDGARAVDQMAALAREMGVVCYDPQAERLH